MSDEEKKAIELTKTIIEFAGDSYIPKENRKALQVILNLIETQQKEIERLKKDNKELDKECQALFEAYNFNDTNLLVKLLKEYRKEIKVLQSLLEED